MTPTWEIREGDALERLREMPDSSVDAVVTDPPYGLEFMGKDWDKLAIPKPGNLGGFADGAKPSFERVRRHLPGMQEWHEAWAREALRVLKPGGHLLAFGGTRTYHRLAAGIEDAGFEVRDCVVWLYGSGFPKSLDVSKAIDRAAGAEREQTGREPRLVTPRAMAPGGAYRTVDPGARFDDPATPDARRWDGWGTALKPAHEPIVVARKSLVGTVAANVLEHGTGALNIDGCRIAGGVRPLRTNEESASGLTGTGGASAYGAFAVRGSRAVGETEAGRWPANVVLDEGAGAMLDEQSGELTSGANPTQRGSDKFRMAYGDFAGQRECEPARGAESGGASRFFYCAKASSAERNAGLDGLEERPLGGQLGQRDGTRMGRSAEEGANLRISVGRNLHPTVKPVELMRWLVRLVTPPGGLILDPFAGSGTTGIAAMREGFSFIGIERESEYVEIARARIRGDAPLLNTPAEVAA